MEFDAVKDAIVAKLMCGQTRNPEEDCKRVADIVVDYIRKEHKYIVLLIQSCRDIFTPLKIHTALYFPEYKYLYASVTNIRRIDKQVLDATGLSVNTDLATGSLVLHIKFDVHA